MTTIAVSQSPTLPVPREQIRVEGNVRQELSQEAVDSHTDIPVVIREPDEAGITSAREADPGPEQLQKGRTSADGGVPNAFLDTNWNRPDNPPVAYDTELADRIRALLLFEPDVSEKRMFGGLAFLVHGHMAVAVSGRGGLLLRVEVDEQEQLMSQPGVSAFEMRGRPLRGWAHVDEEAVTADADLERWVSTGVDLARELPDRSRSDDGQVRL